MAGLLNYPKRRDATEISRLIEVLANGQPVERKRARDALVAVGRPAIGPLIRLVEARHPHVRWEAVKGLGAVGDPEAAPALVKALEDDDEGVRWLAAKGLIDLRRNGLQPLLAALVVRSSSPELLEGARRVLHQLSWERLPKPVKPVLAALSGPSPWLAVHVAAYAALNALRAENASLPGGDEEKPPTF
jgi:HEAT repeat protein